MKSPFPGMDPYLEKHWGDVHSRLVLYTCDQLQTALPGSLFARVEERVYLESDEGIGRSTFPDVRVVELGRRVKTVLGEAISAGNVAVAEEPIIIHIPDDPITETSIVILDAESGNKVVTVIEMLSPSNKKPGEGQKLYQAKQRECIEAMVNLVEIDLLRTGERNLVIPTESIPQQHRTLYQISVFRAWKPQLGEIYPVPLEQRLPSIRIPLRARDDDVRLDLQAVLDQAYRNGRYALTLDYKLPLEPPLPSKEARWARQMIKAARGRS